jgi:uncharacterized membrane protein YbaN (DUF454 family)
MELKRAFFFSLGVTLFGVGAAGVIIPVLPTTPFVLASFFCFGKSSKKAENWISNNRYFGSYIENYKTKQGVPVDIKLKSIAFLWLMLILSCIFFFNQFYIFLLLIIVGITVTAHILRLKTKKLN